MVTIPHPKVAFGDLAERLGAPGEEVSVPRDILTRLLDHYISFWDFDEDWYLANNPDIQDAVAHGKFPSGWEHFKRVGYFEGRRGSQPFVDTQWYVETYPDIAQAMLEGKVVDAAEHFERFGYAEGRLPSDPHLRAEWYAKRYMAAHKSDKVDEKDALDDFVRKGYRNLAFPSPSR